MAVCAVDTIGLSNDLMLTVTERDVIQLASSPNGAASFVAIKRETGERFMRSAVTKMKKRLK